MVLVDVFVIPYDIAYTEDEHHSPELTFELDERSQLLQRLKASGLYFSASVHDEDVCWKGIDTAFTAHFSSRPNFIIPPATTSSDNYDSVRWQLLTPKKKGGTSTLLPLTPTPGKTVTERFTVGQIKKLYKNKWDNSLHDTRPLLLIAPRGRNICGPLTSLAQEHRRGVSDPDVTHRCFSWRIAGTLTKGLRSSIPECFHPCTPATPPPQPAANPAPASPANVPLLHVPPTDNTRPGPPPTLAPLLELHQASSNPHLLPSVHGALQGQASTQQTVPAHIPDANSTALLLASGNVASPTNAVRRPRSESDQAANHGPDQRRARLEVTSSTDTRTLNTNRDYVTGSGAAVRRWRYGLPQPFILVQPPDELFAWEGEEVSKMSESFYEHLTFQHLRDVQPGLAHALGAPSLPHYSCYWPMNLEGLFNELCFVRIGPASGPGPRRGLFRHLVGKHLHSILTDWKRSGEYWIPVSNAPLRRSCPDRIARLRAIGTIMALHTYHLRVGPHPISPFLYYLILCNGPKSTRRDPPVVDFQIDFIRRLSPMAANALELWFALTPEDKLPETSNDPNNNQVYYLLSDASQGRPMEELNIASPRTPSLHAELTRAVVSCVLFGDPMFIYSPEYAAVRDGFDVDIPSQKETIHPPLTPSHPATHSFPITPSSPATSSSSTASSQHATPSSHNMPFTLEKSFIDFFVTTQNKVSELLLGLYNRDIIDVPFIIRSIDFLTYDTSKNARHELNRQMLQFRIVRYLMGKGHVKSPLITEENFEAEKDSATLRAQLFLKVATDSVLIDPEEFEINILTLHPRTNMPQADRERFMDREKLDGGWGEPYLFAHTCTATIEIYINSWLENALYEPLASPDEPGVFDVWFHNVLAHSHGDYSAV